MDRRSLREFVHNPRMETPIPCAQEEPEPGTISLLGSGASPYSRMARLALLEKKLAHKWIEVASPAWRHVNGERIIAWVPNEAWNVEAFNPLGKIPVLLHRERAWYDSRVICAYIECLSPAPALYGPARRSIAPLGSKMLILQIEALCQSICDVIGHAKGVSLREGGNHAKAVYLGARACVEASLQEIQGLRRLADKRLGTTAVTMADIALCTALDYIDFRMPTLVWREEFPALCPPYGRVASRESFMLTRPPAQHDPHRSQEHE